MAESTRSVFISGSRTQNQLSQEVLDSIDAIIDQGIKVNLGDSNKGVDKEVADLLRLENYQSVEIFTINQKPRIAIEKDWKVRYVHPDDNLNGQEQQMMKDRQMANDSHWGLAIFDPIKKNRFGALQVSSGTLRNTIQMLLQGKSVKFFYVFEDATRYHNLKGEEGLKQLEALIDSYQEEKLTGEEKDLILSSRGVNKDDYPATIKRDKIFSKFTDLLQSELQLTDSEDSDFQQTTLF
ncbi:MULTISPECIES: hypothetical protein [Aerococcus]|uniref:Uncharacterized protein n=1 Tax=Aerococcus tenax TaxID=3078812 RepID=A0A5N1BJL1_9LACT|nr:hypothetical protein [Aerococcus urinae]KAA9239796.1 hypothetical protein F6I34_06070 [Aerococcus urinae]MDK6370558.1 hypothetical protein [Aerococcus urinae]MDK6596770.1 hypothetical protein [Aerococcus urinae]MDK7302234.1 hypothetical protein [Aerococcus urinae]MDK7800815.1 hypothetical protein [Aerococcus urinae]